MPSTPATLEDAEELALEALSFIAVLATRAPESDAGSNDPPGKETRGKRKSKRKRAESVGAKTRSRRKQQRQGNDESVTAAANARPDAAAAEETEDFWVAQLLDDVAWEMLDDEAAVVRVAWLDKQPSGRYAYAFDDQVEVQSILCHVLVDEDSTGTFAVTDKSKQRIERRLRLAKGTATAGDQDESEDEKPQRERKRKERAVAGGGGRRAAGSAPKKSGGKRASSKKDDALHPPPHYATVNVDMHLSRELVGDQPHEKDANTTCGNREVIRAVMTKNHALLRQLVEDKAEHKHLRSFRAYQSVDVKTTALQYAIERDDIDAASLLLKADRKMKLGTFPKVSLPNHFTGGGGSGRGFSSYKRPHKVHASRGGKEGNNALLEDGEDWAAELSDEKKFFWHCSTSSVRMLTVLYPGNAWKKDEDKVEKWLARAVHAGNVSLVRKLLAILAREGGWGFNDLFLNVLSPTPQALPKLRKATVLKQAGSLRIRPLHIAALNPDPQYLKQLWEVAGDDRAHLADRKRFQVIHYASVCNGPGPLQFLLEQKCDRNSKTRSGLTPIMCAIRHRRSANAIALLESAAADSEQALKVVVSTASHLYDLKYQAIHFAAKFGCTEVIKKLVELGADVNSVAYERASALCVAAQFGQLDSVVTLLDLGASVNFAARQNKSPLMFAVKNGHTQVAATLINRGANVNAFDSSDNTVAHYAASYGWLSCVELLMDAGADFWSSNAWGVPPVIAAMLKEFTACSKFILERDVKRECMNFRDHEGCTMLFLQCKHSKDLEQIEYFLKNGVDPNIANVRGEYPIQILIRQCVKTSKDSVTFSVAAICLLLQHGARATLEMAVREDGEQVAHPEQPLHMAIWSGARDIVKLLMEEGGVDPNTRSHNMEDAWQTAAKMKEGAMFALLLDKYGADRIDFDGRASSQSNIFHCLAVGEPLSEDALRDTINACPDVSKLMNEHDGRRLSPIMALLQNERAADMNAKPDATFTREKELDRLYSNMMAVYAKYTTDWRAFAQYGTMYATDRQQFAQWTNNAKHAGAKEVDILLRSALHLACPRVLRSDAKTPNTRWFGTHLLQTVVDAISPQDLRQLLNFATAYSFETPLICAVKARDYASVRLLLTRGADTNHSPTVCDQCYPSGRCEWAPCHCSPAKPARGTALVHATLLGDIDMVKLLLEHGASVECVSDAEGSSLVHTALSLSNVEILDTLIAAGASVNGADINGFSPLHQAVLKRKPECVALLLAHGADPALMDEQNCTALLHAVKARYSVEKAQYRADEIQYSPATDTQSALKDLKPATSDTPSGALDAATASAVPSSQTGHFTFGNASSATPSGFGQATASAFGFGAPSVTSGFGSTSAFGQPPSSLFGAGPAATSAFGFGAPSATSGFGSSSTHITTATQPASSLSNAKEEAEVMNILLTNPPVRSSIDIGDKWMRTAIHCAAQQRDLKLLRALLDPLDKTEQSVLVNKRDGFGRTPLHFAVNSATMMTDVTFDVERFLLRCGSDVNAADNFGCVALHFALLKVDMDWFIAYDEAHKAEREEAAKEESTLTQYEAKRESEFIAKLSEIPVSDVTDPVETVSNLAAAKGVNVHHQDVLGRSPLHLAAATGAVVCVSTLLATSPCEGDRVAAFELKDSDGFTPLACAFELLRPTTISALIENGAGITDVLRARKTTGKEAAEAQTFFYHALKHKLPGVCQLLLNNNFPRRQAMEDALKLGDLSLSSNLMGRIEVSSESHLLAEPSTASGGETLMHFLAKIDKPFDEASRTIAWRLIENGLDATVLDAGGNGALHYAAELGTVHAMDFMLHQGCSVNQRTRVGETPLLFALKRIASGDNDRCFRVLNYFLSNQATDVAAEDADGRSALSVLLSRYSKSLGSTEDFCLWVELLLQRGADPNRLMLDKVVPVLAAQQDAPTPPKATIRLPVLSWVAYVDTPSLRMALLALLLKFKTLITQVDENGDSVLMHLVRRNLKDEVCVLFGEYSVVPNAMTGDAGGKGRVQYPISVPRDDVVRVLKQKNKRGETALHLAVAAAKQAFIISLLISAGASVQALDSNNRSVLDCLKAHPNGNLVHYIRKHHAELTAALPAIDREEEDEWEVPDYESDSAMYIRECKASRKIKDIRIAAAVNRNCSAGNGSYVLSWPRPPASDGMDQAQGEDKLAVYLTKVDTTSGPFGVNVFYLMQVVHDKVQDLYILFTNWGRVGESGNFQNTPFKSAEKAVIEFKKVFRSKTGNDWDNRDNFVKQPKKYALVRRVNFHTKVSKEVTQSFLEEITAARKQQAAGDTDHPMDGSTSSPFAPFSSEFPKNLTDLLYAVTDVHTIQLSAPQWSSFAQYMMPPLPINDELKTAMKTLNDLKAHVRKRVELDEEIQKASEGVSEQSVALLVTLSEKLAAVSETISELSSRYLEVMPYNERSMNKSVREYHTTLDVDAELERLRQVSEINQAYKILLGAKLRSRVVHPLEYCVRAMQVKVISLPHDSSEAALISRYFLNGVLPKNRHLYRVASICGLERRGERSRMEQYRQSVAYSSSKGEQGLPANRLLWHGTHRTNLMSIFTQGLRIASSEAHSRNGERFGKGLYFADLAFKSSAFCDAQYSRSSTKFYMLLCEVALGSMMTTDGHRTTSLGEGFHSLLVQGKHAPNPLMDTVSSLTGAVIPVGTVGEVGVQVPARDVWGYADLTERQPNEASPPSFGLTDENIPWLNKLVTTEKPGKMIDMAREHTPVIGGTYGIPSTAEVLKSIGTSAGDASTWEPYDAAVRITTAPTFNSPSRSFELRRYPTGFYDSPCEKGFTNVQVTKYPQRASEFVVYKEEQVRVRYIVEVERASIQ